MNILIITLQDKDWKDKPYLNDFNSMTNSAFSLTTNGSPTKSFSIDNSSRTYTSFSKIKSGRKISSELVNNNYYRLQYWILGLDELKQCLRNLKGLISDAIRS